MLTVYLIVFGLWIADVILLWCAKREADAEADELTWQNEQLANLLDAAITELANERLNSSMLLADQLPLTDHARLRIVKAAI